MSWKAKRFSTQRKWKCRVMPAGHSVLAWEMHWNPSPRCWDPSFPFQGACVLSHFSPTLCLLCPWDSPGKNTQVACRAADTNTKLTITQMTSPGLLLTHLPETIKEAAYLLDWIHISHRQIAPISSGGIQWCHYPDCHITGRGNIRLCLQNGQGFWGLDICQVGS